ncbi:MULTISPECIES: hypothetical protein [Mesorhizobium]|nr:MULTISPECIES: hypothetical protein [Mesorhizobium]ETA73098.1 hypothetical protein MesloDRAFT_2000 [Mesorhizobium japonicum R7A]MBE1709846.1 hypothetical protein [Mesorhizobium japonicum]MBE1716490.1 hypothetical protein [Mesorhizobium japonicum]MUT24524.1 hypothetical protein [Mesorhizobium japonicum]MUT29183.1 hypothetical protein [Mesorhizobium japonicum]
MSDDFHRPTLTFPGGAYNASQVRLYGIPGSGGLVFPGSSKAVGTKNTSISSNMSTGDLKKDEKANAEINKILEGLRAAGENILSDEEIFKTLITTPPFPWPVGMSYQIALDTRNFGKIALSTLLTIEEAARERKLLSCGIIVGYSYEGHCYDLPKPKIMLISAFPQEIPADDCGYDKKNDQPSVADRYMLWIVDKLDECIEFETNQGFVEQIVLEANMPGKRSPTMYASRMMMGHRGGRLGD